MRFQTNKSISYQVQVPLTSLIDIVFLLLVFFLLTSNFITANKIDVNLPEASSATPQTRANITVTIDASGDIHVEGKPVLLDGVENIIKKRIADEPGIGVVIRADKSVTLGLAVPVMDAARSAGADRILLAAEKKDPAGSIP